MNLTIVGHPAQRMVERGVTLLDIEHAIANRHTTLPPQGSRGITYVGPGLNGDDLKVWVLPPGYVDETTTIIIKSVAWKD